MGTGGLKIIVDVGVGKGVEDGLSARGYDTKRLRELDPQMVDRELLRISAAEGRMVITMDRDFGWLACSCGLSHAGVLLLRLEGYNSSERVAAVRKILQEHRTEVSGRFCVFEDGRLRVR